MGALMLRVTRLTDYATLILSYLASMPAQVVSAKSLSEIFNNIGSATVSKILKMLSAENILCATRGAEGGYKLHKAPEEISLVDILVAMEGRLALTECSMSGHHCNHSHDCSVQNHWQRINKVMIDALRQVSLADLAQPTGNIPFVISPEDIQKMRKVWQ